MSKEDVRLHKSTGADALPMNRLLAGEPAVPADSTMVQDAKDEAQDDGLKPSIDEAQAQPSVNDEGGPSGVRAVIGGFFISFCTWGYAGSWTVFQSYYETDELSTLSPSQISWIGSIQICCVYLSSAVGGRLFDNGHMRRILLFSCLATTLGFMMASISSQYWHYILSQGFLTGIGLGSSFSPALACVSSYYRRKRGLANGLLSAGSAIGGLIIPIYLSKMINNQSIGLAWSLRTSGFICFVLQGSAVLLLQQKTTAPSDRPLFDISIFRQRAYAITTGGLFLTTAAVFVFYIQPFAVSKGVDDGLVFYSIAILNGASLIGRLAPPIASDKLGPFNVLVLTNVSACILMFAFCGIQNFAGVAAFSAFNGIAYGSYVTVNPVVLANLSDHPSRIGTHIGMSFMLNAIAALGAPPALGAVITATGAYWPSALIAGGLLVISIVLLATGNKLLRSSKGTWRV